MGCPKEKTQKVCDNVDFLRGVEVFIAGSLVDMWQRGTTDIGVTGPDKGRGAKFLLVGPGLQVPEAPGFVVVRSPTFRTIVFFRALDPDPAKANALKTGVQVYRFAHSGIIRSRPVI